MTKRDPDQFAALIAEISAASRDNGSTAHVCGLMHRLAVFVSQMREAVEDNAAIADCERSSSVHEYTYRVALANVEWLRTFDSSFKAADIIDRLLATVDKETP